MQLIEEVIDLGGGICILMSDSIYAPIVNAKTESFFTVSTLFCCKFNLVDTDQYSCECLVWILCYSSQIVVFFSNG